MVKTNNIVVHITLDEVELLNSLYQYIKDYDIYISTNNSLNKSKIEKYFVKKKFKNEISVKVFDNFISSIDSLVKSLRNKIDDYNYIINLDGLDKNILDNKKLIFETFKENPSLGLISSKKISNNSFSINQELLGELESKLEITDVYSNDIMESNTFIARVDAIRPIFDLDFIGNDDTINKLIIYLIDDRGYSYYIIDNGIIRKSQTLNINDYNIKEYDYRLEIYNLLNENKRLKDGYRRLVNSYNEGLQHYKNNNLKLENELKSIINSKSWKVTKPLRYFMNLFSKRNKEVVVENEIKDEVLKTRYEDCPSCDIKYQDNIDFSGYETDIKPITFYLPQFHTFKENDEWWGKGFTEWTNTKKSKPRFDGHYQPRVPHKDIGYYKLDNIETIKKQIELAKEHGIYGFCFYYYWFSGKRLMEKPLDLFLEHKEIDFPFCLCWANENWTRRWDGLDREVLIKQEYNLDDNKKFIEDIKKYLLDDRYIKIDNKPLLLVYKPENIPNFLNMIKEWREYARELGIGELYIITQGAAFNVNSYNNTVVDGEFDFPPHAMEFESVKLNNSSTTRAYDYKKTVNMIDKLYRKHFPLKDYYYTVTMAWDNSSRRKEKYLVYCNYSIESFYKWLRIIIRETRKRQKKDNRFIFINAWNEWAEGTYLEPDEKCGYANINTLSKAIYDLSFDLEDDKIK